MRDVDRRKPRRAVAITKAALSDGQFVDIVILSLAGLSFALLETSQYAAHTGLLGAMFAP